MTRNHDSKRLYVSVLAALAVLVQAALAHAQDSEKSVAVLAFARPAAQEQLAFELTERVRDEVSRTPGYELKPVRASLEQLSMVQDCDETSPDCLKQIADQLSVDLLVLGAVVLDGGSALVSVQRFDVASMRIVGEASATVSAKRPGAPEVRERAKEIVDALFARASDEPAPTPAPPDAIPGAPMREHDTSNVDAIDAAIEPNDASSSGVSVRKTAAYSLLGVAVVSAGMSVLSFVQIDRAGGNQTFTDYRVAVGDQNPGADDVCAEAEKGRRYGLTAKDLATVKDQCSAGETFGVLQYVFLGTALVAGGASAFLFLSDDGPSERASAGPSKLALRPRMGVRDASLSATLRF